MINHNLHVSAEAARTIHGCTERLLGMQGLLVHPGCTMSNQERSDLLGALYRAFSSLISAQNAEGEEYRRAEEIERRVRRALAAHQQALQIELELKMGERGEGEPVRVGEVVGEVVARLPETQHNWVAGPQIYVDSGEEGEGSDRVG